MYRFTEAQTVTMNIKSLTSLIIFNVMLLSEIMGVLDLSNGAQRGVLR